MNTSMTINAQRRAPRPVRGERPGPGRRPASSRAPPERHREGVLSAGPTSSRRSPVFAYRGHDRLHRAPHAKWNPINVCSYHLQEAGATPVKRSRTHLATPCVLDACGVGKVRDETRNGRRPHQLLRQLRGALRRRDVQDARLHADVGPDLRERYGVTTRSSAASATASR